LVWTIGNVLQKFNTLGIKLSKIAILTQAVRASTFFLDEKTREKNQGCE